MAWVTVNYGVDGWWLGGFITGLIAQLSQSQWHITTTVQQMEGDFSRKSCCLDCAEKHDKHTASTHLSLKLMWLIVPSVLLLLHYTVFNIWQLVLVPSPNDINDILYMIEIIKYASHTLNFPSVVLEFQFPLFFPLKLLISPSAHSLQADRQREKEGVGLWRPSSFTPEPLLVQVLGKICMRFI